MPPAIRSLTPSVPRKWLLWCATLVWMGVGTGLCGVALNWLTASDWLERTTTTAFGLAMGLVLCRFAFSRIARRNVERIRALPDPVCLFAFQAWRSYALILLMMGLGLGLRHSALPRKQLAPIYLAMGSGLLLCSACYLRSPTRPAAPAGNEDSANPSERG